MDKQEIIVQSTLFVCCRGFSCYFGSGWYTGSSIKHATGPTGSTVHSYALHSLRVSVLPTVTDPPVVILNITILLFILLPSLIGEFAKQTLRDE